jgi:hypothetical protein
MSKQQEQEKLELAKIIYTSVQADETSLILAERIQSSGYVNINNIKLTGIAEPKTVGEAREICEKYGLKTSALDVRFKCGMPEIMKSISDTLKDGK